MNPEFFRLVATKLFNKTEDEVNAIFFEKDGENWKPKDNAADLFLQMDAERVTKLKGSNTELLTQKFNEGHQKGTSEAMSKFEKAFREKYNVQSDATGLDLIDHHIATIAKSGGKDVKLTPEYLELETRKNKELQEINRQWEEKIKGIEQEWNRNKTLEEIYSIADSQLPVLGAVFPDNPVIARNINQAFKSQLKEFEYQKEGDEWLMIKDGKRVEDAHGNPVKFTAKLAEIASGYYPFKKQESKGNSGGGNGDGKDDFTPENVTIKSLDEYNSMVAKYQGNSKMLLALKAAKDKFMAGK